MDEPLLSSIRAETFDARIKVPFAMVCSGSPQTGKSVFIKNLLIQKDRILERPADRVVYFYGEESQTVGEIRNEMKDVILVPGLPDELSDYYLQDGHTLCVFDDLQAAVSNSKDIASLVTSHSQHRCVSWIITFQNAFLRAPERVTITRAANCLVVFKTPLDMTVPHLLASRILPNNRQAFLNIFADATKDSHGYLFCDGHPRTLDKARLRTRLFEEFQIVYTPTKRKR